MWKHELSRITVVGAGVIGLTCGIRLLEQGYEVTIVARDLPPKTNSNAAAAIWYIYAVHPLERAQHWASTSLNVYRQLRDVGGTGVSTITIQEYLVEPSTELWWEGLLHDTTPIPRNELPDGYAEGYRITVPLIETPIYMSYLVQRFLENGGEIVQREIQSLEGLYAAGQIIVNCSGIGARHLAADPEVYPIQGQTVRVAAPTVLAGFMDEDPPTAPTYIFPRSDGCILGGTARPNVWGLEPDPEVTQEIIARCAKVEPSLRDAPILGLSVGLRPGRPAVRLELEPTLEPCPLIHNYGHGGAGFTLSWGCADEVVALARNLEGKQ
jgi:D-amino-acid oxidase